MTPHLVVEGADKVVEFISSVFNAEKVSCMRGPGGEIMNAEYRIGDSMLMLAETKQGYNMPGSFYVYVEDTDASYRKALDAGADSLMEPSDQFYGDRNAGVKDATGNCWWIATHIEDLTFEEIEDRAAAFQKQSG